jgi:uncharacterized protein (TIGR03437 family)
MSLKRWAGLFALTLTAPGQAFAATPYIQRHGIVNAASLVPRGLPNGDIAQGSLFRILGSSLGPPTAVFARGYPLAFSLAGVTVTAAPPGGASYSCLPVFVSDSKVEAVLPSNVPPGDVLIRVFFNQVASNPAPASVVGHSPGLFSVRDTGYGPAVTSHSPHFLEGQAPNPNSIQAAVAQGDKTTVWATGLGGISTPDNQAAPAAALWQSVEAYIGNRPAKVVSISRPVDDAAADALLLEVPADSPTGCYVPVQIKAGSVASNVVTIPITAGKGGCADTFNPFTAALRAGGNLATLGIAHTSVTRSSSPGDGVFDQAFATFGAQPGGDRAFDRLYSFPPPASCTLYSGQGNLLIGEGVGIPIHGLDAGALSLQGPVTSQALKHFFGPDFYFKLLFQSGFGSPPFGSMPLSPGNYTMRSDGTGQIGAFQATAVLPGPPVWLSPAELAGISRTQPLNISWSAPGGGQVIVTGGNYDIARDASAAFVCVANAGAGSLSVPIEILSAIPTYRASTVINYGRMHLSLFPAPTSFGAPGLSFGGFISPSDLTREVIFQ